MILQGAKLRLHSADFISFPRMWRETAKDPSLLMKANVLVFLLILDAEAWLALHTEVGSMLHLSVCPGK